MSGGDDIGQDLKQDYLKQIVKESKASIRDFKYIKSSFKEATKHVKIRGNIKRLDEFKTVFKGVIGVLGEPEEALKLSKAISKLLKIKVAILDGDIVAPQLDFYESFSPKFKNHTSHLSNQDATSLNLLIYEYNAKGHLTPKVETIGIQLSSNLTLFSGNYNPINFKYYSNAPFNEIFSQLSHLYDLIIVSFSKEYLSNPLLKSVLENSKFNLFYLSNFHSEARYIQNVLDVLKSSTQVEAYRNIGVVSLSKSFDLSVYESIYNMSVVRLSRGTKRYKKLLWSIVWELA